MAESDQDDESKRSARRWTPQHERFFRRLTILGGALFVIDGARAFVDDEWVSGAVQVVIGLTMMLAARRYYAWVGARPIGAPSDAQLNLWFPWWGWVARLRKPLRIAITLFVMAIPVWVLQSIQFGGVTLKGGIIVAGSYAFAFVVWMLADRTP